MKTREPKNTHKVLQRNSSATHDVDNIITEPMFVDNRESTASLKNTQVMMNSNHQTQQFKTGNRNSNLKKANNYSVLQAAELRQLSTDSYENPKLLAAPENGIIQRVILPMDNDSVTTDHVAFMQQNKVSMASNIEPGHKPVAVERGVLTGIGNETIYIAGHGSPSTLSGIPPERMALYLTKLGLTSEYKGKIVLISCNTGEETKKGNPLSSYAGQLQTALFDKHEIAVSISAPIGAAKVARNNFFDPSEPFNIRSIQPGKTKAFESASDELMLEYKTNVGVIQEQRTTLREQGDIVGKKLLLVDEQLKKLNREKSSLTKGIDAINSELERLKKILTATEPETVAQDTVAIGELMRNLSIEAGTLEEELQSLLSSVNEDTLKSEEALLRKGLLANLAESRHLDGMIDELRVRMGETMKKISAAFYMDTDKGMLNLPAPSKPCFLTTACTEAMGLADDCYELQTLRAFRDGFMLMQPDGRALIEEYYQIAPPILEGIRAHPYADFILYVLYKRMVLGAIALIESGNLRGALAHYKNSTLELKSFFLENKMRDND